MRSSIPSMTTILCCVLGLGMSAQQIPDAMPRAAADGIMTHRSFDQGQAKGGGGTVVWSEDFSNGFPAGWTVTNPSGMLEWRWSNDGSYGWWNGNDATTSGDTIMSTTAANGFLICDNDSANHFNFGQPSGTTYQYLASYFTTAPIDLSATPNVTLEFEQFFRYNNSPVLSVEVSPDGNSWTQWDVKNSVQANTASDNVDHVSINISAAAAGSATTYIRIGWDARVYFWMIDDMKLVVSPSHDLRLVDAFYDEWFFATSTSFDDLEYSIYPITQLRELTMKGLVSNEGSATQTNVVFSVDVTDQSSTSVFTGTDTRAAVPSLSLDSMYITGYMPSATTGDYDISYTLSADSTDAVPTDNELTKQFSISDHIYARDRGSLADQYNNLQNPGAVFEIGNRFHLANAQDVYGVDVAVGDDTQAGTLIYAAIYDDQGDPVDISSDHMIGASELNGTGGSTWKTIVFDSPVPLQASSDYSVVVGHYGGVDDLWIGTSGTSVPQTSRLFDGSDNTWYYITRTPMVRMNFDPTVDVHEQLGDNGVMLLQGRPNPATDRARIAYRLHQGGSATLQVVDLNGKVLRQLDQGNRAAGLHEVVLNVAELNNGTYLYRLITDRGVSAKRLTVIH